MTKKELRELYLRLRMEIPKTQYHNMNESIHNLFFKHFVLPAQTKPIIHTYLSNNDINEVDTWNIIKMLEKKTTQICVPKINLNTNDISNCILNQNAVLNKNKWNIYEPDHCNILDPKKLDLIIVPCIICDLQGYRIGYGKGYYDRFLTKVSNNTIKITLSFFDLVKSIKDIDTFDIPMDYCITPYEIVSFIKNNVVK